MNGEKKEKKKAIQELHIDTQTLYNRLEKVPANNPIITNQELNALIGRDVQHEAYGNLKTARYMMQREHGIIFEPIRNIGLKRLSDNEIPSLGPSGIKRMRNVARKTTKKLTCVSNFDNLSNEQKLIHNASLSIFGIVSQVTTQASLKKIENTISKTQIQLPIPIAKTMEAIMGSSM